MRGSVMTGSGRTGRKATRRQQAAHTGAQRATAPLRPEPFSLSSACGHGSPGWGETPLERLIGFERQIGPYAVAELKLEQALEAHEANARDEDLRLYVADTLDDPAKVPLPVRGRVYAPLAASRRAANKVKTDEDVMVVLGNPPYRARAMSQGKWVLEKEGRQKSLLDDFREHDYGKYEYKLHDLAIYFWRWSLWKAFESTSDSRGIVAFITTNAYLDGPGFAGMRRYLREHADFGWIVDLSPEGHWSPIRTRIFPGVPHPVCIGIFAHGSNVPKSLRKMSYLAISGDQAEKFEALKDVGVNGSGWMKCASGPTASMRSARLESWLQYPAIEDLLPYTSLGVTCNRAWVRAPEKEVLARRWRRLIMADAEEKRALMKETRDRTIDKLVPVFPGEHVALPLRIETSPVPRIEPIGFRSFDRQYLIADQRVVDFLRPDLWRLRGEKQVFLITQLRESLTSGPAVVFSAEVPDTHYFKGHHGGRVIPLYRDSRQRIPNVAPGLLALLSRRLETAVADDDFLAYIAAVAAHAGYTRRFHDELTQPGVRIPLTAVPQLWQEAVDIGRRVIWLHTFGERFIDESRGRPLRKLPGRPDVQYPIPGRPEQLPGRIEYQPLDNCLVIGWDQFGRIGPVTPGAAEYEISGMRVISHWFDYRKRNPSGRRGASDLDAENIQKWTSRMTEELRNVVAVLEGCVSLEKRQTNLLDRIVNGPILSAAELTEAAVVPPPDAFRRLLAPDDDMTLF